MLQLGKLRPSEEKGLSFPNCNTRVRTQYFLKSHLFLGMLTDRNKNLGDRRKLGKCWVKPGRVSCLQDFSEPLIC